MKTRLLGAAILIALAVIFVPMFFSGSPVPDNGEKNISLEIPPAPGSAQKPATAASAAGPVIAGPDQPSSPPTPPPAAVAIPAQGPSAPRRRETAAPSVPSAIKPSPSAPVIPPARTTAVPARKAPAHKPQIPAQRAAGAAKSSTGGHYLLNLSAYAATASAKNLVQKVQALGYPVAVSPLTSGGKTLAHVTAGPFASRNDAEAARRQIVQAIPGVPARVEETTAAAAATPPAKPAAAAAPAAGKSGHWAVQIAAVSSQSDAVQLRNRLHGAGFPAYIDSATVNGKSIWRVRVGPSPSRDEASKQLDQIQAKLKLNGNIVGGG